MCYTKLSRLFNRICRNPGHKKNVNTFDTFNIIKTYSFFISCYITYNFPIFSRYKK